MPGGAHRAGQLQMDAHYRLAFRRVKVWVLHPPQNGETIGDGNSLQILG